MKLCGNASNVVAAVSVTYEILSYGSFLMVLSISNSWLHDGRGYLTLKCGEMINLLHRYLPTVRITCKTCVKSPPRRQCVHGWESGDVSVRHKVIYDWQMNRKHEPALSK